MGAIARPAANVIEQAAEWAALLDDARAGEDDRRACDDWCSQDPMHRLAFERMGGITARFTALDEAQKRALVPQSKTSNVMPRLAGGLACLSLLMGSMWLATTNFTLRALWPDHVTATGQQLALTMPDGSELIADTATRFSGYDAQRKRQVMLFEGQVMATVAPDPGSPFSIVTREGSASALGTRYSVQTADKRTIVTVIESRVRLCPRTGECRVLSAGQRAWMTRDQIGPTENVDPELAALWSTGWIEAHDRPLVEVLEQLSRYSPAGITYDARELTGITVTGSYPLIRPDAALQSIAETAGISLTRSTNGRMTISRRK